jgi:hypothetical protein
MRPSRQLTSVTRFCGKCSCGCPELFVDHEAPVERRIVIADDFGQRIQMSLEQLETLVEDVKAGKLEDLVPTS